MKLIFQIFKTEVRLLFYSPIAWIIFMIFALQSGLIFSNTLDNLLLSQELDGSLWMITRELVSQSILPNAQNYLFLYMPMLTMGLIGKEVSSGSFKLLQSSPVRVRDIILGKYMAMLFIALLMTLLLFVEVIFAWTIVPHFDYSAAIIGLTGFFLLASAYAAVGLFMSCLFNNQMLAALCSIVLLALLTYVSEFGQDNLFIREITYWLSFKSHSTGMINGVLHSEDLIYFLMMMAAFVSFSMLHLWFERNSLTLKKEVLNYSLVIAVLLGVGILSFQPRLKFSIDFTDTGINSLKKEFRDVLDDVDGEIKITSYVNLFDNKSKQYFPEHIINDRNKYDLYYRHKPSTQMEYVFYYNNPGIESDKELEKQARREAIQSRTNLRRFLSREEVKEIDPLLKSEAYSFFRVVEATKTGCKAIIRTYNDPQVVESDSEVIAAIKKVSGTQPEIAYLTGHTKRMSDGQSDEDYGYLLKQPKNRTSFENQGFAITDLQLSKDKEIDSNLCFLMIADPVKVFEEWELKKIGKYIEQGGNLMLLADENSIANCNEIGKFLGMQFETTQVFQDNESFPSDLLTSYIPKSAIQVHDKYKYMAQYNDYVLNFGAYSMVVADSTKGFKIIPLLETKADVSWKQTETGEKQYAKNQIAYALERKLGDKKQCIFLMGDADMFTDGELKASRRGKTPYINSFKEYLLNWYTADALPLTNDRPGGDEKEIKYKKDNMFGVKLAYIGIIPFFFLVFGSVLLMRRKKR